MTTKTKLMENARNLRKLLARADACALRMLEHPHTTPEMLAELRQTMLRLNTIRLETHVSMQQANILSYDWGGPTGFTLLRPAMEDNQ
jgi:hypothetical protein